MTERRFLVDSNICVYLLDGASEPIRRRVADCFPGELVTSSIVYAEVGKGIDRSDADIVAGFEYLFEQIEVLPFDAKCATAYWALPFRRGKFDRLIAAHALAVEVPIATANPRDFQDVPSLVVEHWAP